MEGNGEDGGGQVHEPVGKDGADSDENEVIPEVGAVLFNHLAERPETLRGKLLDNATTNEVAEEVSSRGSTSRKLVYNG